MVRREHTEVRKVEINRRCKSAKGFIFTPVEDKKTFIDCRAI